MSTVHQPTRTSQRPPRHFTRAEQQRILALSDERDRWQARELDAERRGYLRGQEAGWQAGYEAGYTASDREWRYALAPARKLARQAASGPLRAVVEANRWGPGGREHFGDPRPGDFTGRGQ